MKKTLTIACMAMTLAVAPFIACNKAGSIPNEEKLQLEAPSGEKIAASAAELMKEASAIITEISGKKQEFQLTGVEYLDVNKGFAATVTYQLSDGTTGNFAIVEGVGFTLDSKSVTTRRPAKKSNDNTVLADEGGSSRVTLVCQRDPGSPCECTIRGVVDLVTGLITWSCNCSSTCQMVIIIS